MEYNELYDVLKSHFDQCQSRVEIKDLNIVIDKVPFVSQSGQYMYSEIEHQCDDHNQKFPIQEVHHKTYGFSSVDIKDLDIENNKSFHYYIVKSSDIEVASEALIFFHGLNEKKWDKYLPWAYELAKRTKKAVILFPIAFHMNRAESIWSDRHAMQEVAKFRKTQFPENTNYSFVNAAISSRLEAHPQRIFWSGLQTYSDCIQLVDDLKDGKIKGVSAEATIDLFGYSIGSFFSMILKMANPKSYFSDSKLFCFCGGMTIDRMFPISKYIMDARSAIKMQTVFAELLSSEFVGDERLAHFQDENLHPNESWFKKMLRYNYFQRDREIRIAELENQIKAYVLEKDEVAPPIEALNSFKGGFRNINVDVEIMDYPFEYSHMVPFPLTKKNATAISAAFDHFISSACRFYQR